MSVPPRLADLVRKARRLAAERDRLIEALAVEWARALKGQRLSAADLDELWAGLTEDAVRRRGEARGAGRVAHAWAPRRGPPLAVTAHSSVTPRGARTLPEHPRQPR